MPVRKPHRQDFVRVHRDEAYRLSPTAIIELKEDREVFLVTPQMAAELPGEFTTAALYTTISRQAVLHLWPVKLPGSDGKHNEWHRSAAEAAELAMHKWVRVTANMSLGAYEVFEATGDLPEPTWPDLPFEKLLEIAFRDRIVDRLDHPVVQRLRGGSVTMRATDVCRRAADLVVDDRARQYGDVRLLHARIAALWSAHLGYLITPHDVALMMLLLKVARTAGGTFNPDNYIDAAGYAGLAAELADDV